MPARMTRGMVIHHADTPRTTKRHVSSMRECEIAMCRFHRVDDAPAQAAPDGRRLLLLLFHLIVRLTLLLFCGIIRYDTQAGAPRRGSGAHVRTRLPDVSFDEGAVPDDDALKALGDFGYDVADVTEDELLAKKLLIRQYVVETDIHPFVAGTTFEKVWEHKVEDFYGDTPVYFASLDDLIEMKKAAGRPRDLEDLKYLEEIRNRTSS
jgi:hypothetical protein